MMNSNTPAVRGHGFDRDTCCICTELFDDEAPCLLKCGHLFHSNCIYTWFATSLTCPLCKTRFIAARRSVQNDMCPVWKHQLVQLQGFDFTKQFEAIVRTLNDELEQRQGPLVDYACTAEPPLPPAATPAHLYLTAQRASFRSCLLDAAMHGWNERQKRKTAEERKMEEEASHMASQIQAIMADVERVREQSQILADSALNQQSTFRKNASDASMYANAVASITHRHALHRAMALVVPHLQSAPSPLPLTNVELELAKLRKSYTPSMLHFVNSHLSRWIRTQYASKWEKKKDLGRTDDEMLAHHHDEKENIAKAVQKAERMRHKLRSTIAAEEAEMQRIQDARNLKKLAKEAADMVPVATFVPTRMQGVKRARPLSFRSGGSAFRSLASGGSFIPTSSLGSSEFIANDAFLRKRKRSKQAQQGRRRRR